jgi:hypothetical protein
MKMVVLFVAAVASAGAVALVMQPKTEVVAAPPVEDAPSATRAADETVAPSSTELTGEVREVLEVPQYTYLRLATSSGEAWAAIAKAPVSIGSKVTISEAARMEQFASASLKRTFDVIYFGNLRGSATGAVSDRAALPPNHPPLDMGPGREHGHGSNATPAPSALPQVTVEPARGPNAKTIAALYGETAKLEGKVLRVRGQVTKLTPAVQGKNYIRMRDSSGSPAAQSDLVVTTNTEAKLGDVVTFEGTLRRNVDVGIGFKYPILLENAAQISE